jgi:transcriptional regulator with XRE-family HTH domain
MFAEEMRAHRAHAGLSRDDLAGRLHFSPSLVAMVEAGYRAPSRDFSARLDEVFGVPGTFTRLHERLREVPFPQAFRPFTGYEATATALRWYEHSLVPGLLQTEAYARAVLSTRPNTSGEEIDELVAARMERQDTLTREDPPLLYVLLDEGVLHRPVAEPGVMHGQMEYLLEMSRRPNVTIQVVPYAAGGHSGLLGAFIIAEMGEAPGIVFLEDACDGRVAEDAAMVAQAMRNFDALRSEALTRGISRDLIEKIAKDQWT